MQAFYLGIGATGVTHDQAAIRPAGKETREQSCVICTRLEGVGAGKGRIDRNSELSCLAPEAKTQDVEHQRLVIPQPSSGTRPSALPDPCGRRTLGDDLQKGVAYLRKQLDMLMAIEKIRRPSERADELFELRRDFTGERFRLQSPC